MKDFSLDTLNQRMEQLHSSPEYLANCQHFSLECARLEEIANGLCSRKEEILANCLENTVRKEYASGSTLHRGYYCPSPTYDIIVGNTKRGKLLKRLTVLSKPSHEYGFDANDNLLYCKWLSEGRPVYVEYLVYEKHRIYGITFSQDGNLAFLTEEILQSGKLTNYFYGLFLPLNGAFRCMETSQEHYEYDTEGLFACDMHHYIQAPPAPPGVSESVLSLIPKAVYQHIGKYTFRRKNGLLVSYTNQQGHEYQVFKQRNA